MIELYEPIAHEPLYLEHHFRVLQVTSEHAPKSALKLTPLKKNFLKDKIQTEKRRFFRILIFAKDLDSQETRSSPSE